MPGASAIKRGWAMTYTQFNDTYSVRLNPQQEAAVRQVDGPVLLLAVPGSGKTTVLVTRLGYTVAATKDMKARFVRFFGEDHADKLTFRTINGLCAVVIRYYAARKGTQPFALADDEARLNAVVRELLSKGGDGYASDQQVKEARTYITFCKNMMFSDAEVEAQKVDGMDFPAVYKCYQAFLLFCGQMSTARRLIWPSFITVKILTSQANMYAVHTPAHNGAWIVLIQRVIAFCIKHW